MKKKKQLITLENLIKFFGPNKGINLFVLRYLNRKKYYDNVIDKLEESFSDDLTSINQQIKNLPLNSIDDSDCNIWVLWYQGLKTAPQVVKNNAEQLKTLTQNTKYKVIFLDKENISKYLVLPNYINEKVKKGQITLTHLSDIIRAGLLSEHGGIWLDSTCYVKENNFDNITQYYFYTQKYKPGVSKFFNEGKWSGFFMASGKKNPLEVYLYNMFLKYWKKYDVMVDYFLIDVFLEIGYRNFPELKKIIDQVPYNNPDIMDGSNRIKKSTSTWIYKLDWRKA